MSNRCLLVLYISLYIRHNNFGFSYTEKVQILLMVIPEIHTVCTPPPQRKWDTNPSSSILVHFITICQLFSLGRAMVFSGMTSSQTLFTVHAIPSLICNLFMMPFHLISTSTPSYGWRLVKF